MNPRSELKKHYAKIGDSTNDFRCQALFAWICRHLEQSPVLDFGCGTGGFLRFLKNKKGWLGVGLDPDPEMVLRAKAFDPALDFCVGGIGTAAALQGAFGTIVLIDVLEHISDDEQTLVQLQDKLLPGGRLIVAVPAYPGLFGQRDLAIGHYRRYQKAELVKKIEKAGYAVRQIRYWNMLGVIPYAVSQKLLGKTEGCSWRNADSGGLLEKIMRQILHGWYVCVENNISAGWGLTLLCVASKVS